MFHHLIRAECARPGTSFVAVAHSRGINADLLL